MSYGKLNTTINLRGRSFIKESVVRVWKLDRVTTIQPLDGNENLWYSVPPLHLRHISELETYETNLIDFGII